MSVCNFEYKVIFIHVPKTAGASMEAKGASKESDSKGRKHPIRTMVSESLFWGARIVLIEVFMHKIFTFKGNNRIFRQFFGQKGEYDGYSKKDQ